MMNSGVLANMILFLFSILIITGWFHHFIEGFGSKRNLVLYFIMIIILSNTEVSIVNGLQINIGGFLLPIIGYLYLLFKVIKKDTLYILTATILLATSYFLFKELIRLDPVLLFWGELYQVSALLVIIIIFVVPKYTYRITLLHGGILLGEFIFYFHHRATFTNVILGDGEIRDIMWFSFIEIIIYEQIIQLIKGWIKRKKYHFYKT